MSYIEGIKIDYDTADRIVLEVLKEDYLMVKENLANVNTRIKGQEPTVADFLVQDRDYDKKLLKAIKRVLRYYMVKGDYDRFIEENK
jgi:hypothetical protein